MDKIRYKKIVSLDFFLFFNEGKNVNAYSRTELEKS